MCDQTRIAHLGQSTSVYDPPRPSIEQVLRASSPRFGPYYPPIRSLNRQPQLFSVPTINISGKSVPLISPKNPIVERETEEEEREEARQQAQLEREEAERVARELAEEKRCEEEGAQRKEKERRKIQAQERVIAEKEKELVALNKLLQRAEAECALREQNVRAKEKELEQEQDVLGNMLESQPDTSSKLPYTPFVFHRNFQLIHPG